MDHSDRIRKFLETESITASAPCRIDLGGTLDISSFYYPLQYLNPCTFNIAISLRTAVSIFSHRKGYIKISSKGFDDAEFPIDQIPFQHPMGLMFAVAAYFHIHGLHIHIESASPPRSALGGSSSAAIALLGAYNKIFEALNMEVISTEQIPLLAHAIEEGVAGVPCGLQDQLAAAFGGINAWFWKGRGASCLYIRRQLASPSLYPDIEKHLLLAYCGIPHESVNVNSQWVRQFLSGQFRSHWREIVQCTNAFVEAFSQLDIKQCVTLMNRETSIRLEMTPAVLDATGAQLFQQAIRHGCGARFTGAGAGGCVWALGKPSDIATLKPYWAETLSKIPQACLLDIAIDSVGLC